VPVEDAASGVGNGFVVIVAFDEDGEEAGDASLGAFTARHGALQEAGSSAKTVGV